MTEKQNRRKFLKLTSGAMAGAALQSPPASGRSAGEKVVVGLIGCGVRGAKPGAGLAGEIMAWGHAELAWICDPYESRRTFAAAQYGVDGRHAASDMRRILDDPSVDAVFIATPDHWHCPAALLAAQAGKHIYVEKPLSHHLREGRLLVEAAERNKVLVQHGTQMRSTRMFMEVAKMLREGLIGDVLSAKCWNVQRRTSLGREQPGKAPAELDYDTWVGPAPMIPYQTNHVASANGWSHCAAFGSGDMGNDGIHELDQARLGLGVETHPKRISALGTNSFFDDDCEFPDTQQVVFEFAGDGTVRHPRTLIYEQRMWSTNYPYNVDNGVEFYGTKGQLFVSRRGKLQLRGEDNQIKEIPLRPTPFNGQSHVTNFLDAVRNGNRSILTADALIGHFSVSLTHLGNIATRVMRTISFDPQAEEIIGDDEANTLVNGNYREHWGTPKG